VYLRHTLINTGFPQSLKKKKKLQNFKAISFVVF